jgi:hypothetical protein
MAAMRYRGSVELAIAAAIAAAACKDSAPEGDVKPRAWRHIVALHALGDGTALALLGVGNASAVARFDDHGLMLWQTPVRGNVQVRGGVVATGGLALVRHFDKTASSVAAFALDSGKLRWDTPIGPGTGADDGDTFIAATAFDGIVVEPIARHEPGRPAEIAADVTVVGLDPQRGTVLWERTVPGDFDIPIATDHMLVLQRPSTAVVFDRTGFRKELTTLGTGCAIAGTFVELMSRPEGAMLVAYDTADADHARTLAGPISPGVHGNSPPFLESCGRRGDKLVLLILDGPDQQRESYVVIVDAGKVANILPLGRVWPMPRGMLSAELSRFVPVPLGEIEPRRSSYDLAMLDLDLATVAWRSPKGVDLWGFKLMQLGARWYGWSFPSVIHMFDGETGELRAAISVEHGIWPFEPQQIGRDAIWLVKSPDKPAVLDPATLAPRLSSGLIITDVTATERRRLAPDR